MTEEERRPGWVPEPYGGWRQVDPLGGDGSDEVPPASNEAAPPPAPKDPIWKLVGVIGLVLVALLVYAWMSSSTPAPSDEPPAAGVRPETDAEWYLATSKDVTDMGAAMDRLAAAATGTDWDAMADACTDLGVSNLRVTQRLPSPDPELTRHLTDATDEFATAAETCIIASGEMDPHRFEVATGHITAGTQATGLALARLEALQR